MVLLLFLSWSHLIFSNSPHVFVVRTKFLFVLGTKSSVGLQADRVDADESLGISRVVVEGVSATLDIHGCKVGIVERLVGLTAHDGQVTLVKFNLYQTLNVSLGEVNGVTDKFHFWCEPEAIVAKTSEFSGERLGDALDLAVHADSLHVKVGFPKKGSSRGLVNTTGFDSNESVFDNVDTSNSVLASNLVAVEEEFEGIGLNSSVGHVGDLDRNTVLEFDLHNLRCVWGILGGDSHFEHGLFRTNHGVFEHTTLVGSVEEVLVDRVVGLWFGIDWDAVLLAVSQQVLTTLE
mmetsp:Transcript_18177/g.30146  ORF Transcript_18177/g.30146 Transcript_18177/m.30146 type:complete len:291 (-) Transcript_18177:561-1433(-)